MISRIEIDPIEKDSESSIIEKRLKELGFDVVVKKSDVYTIVHEFDAGTLGRIAEALYNPVTARARKDSPYRGDFDWALELGFLPGVTDNVATTTREIINDLLKTDIGLNKVFTSKVLFIKGELDRQKIGLIAEGLINTLIERYHVKSREEYVKDGQMDYLIPTVSIDEKQEAIEVDIELADDQLQVLGKEGIKDPYTGQRRGPLALDLDYFKAIRDYYSKEGRKPTDIELESIAQTWSEHCKHTYFAGKIDDIEEGIFDHYIRRATDEIRTELEDDFCLSVFSDNSGAIAFDDEYLVSDKVETHNSPSALDPYGGAITGIVGVNRDTIGFGMGAKPVANRYGFCFGRPEEKRVLYKGKDRKAPVLSPKRIMEGVVEGVNHGGNCSGIPTPHGFVFFDDNYRGKPLVFVGTIGLMPRELPSGKAAFLKKAKAGDNIVVIGGRVGKDGIHGATFSSEAMNEGSPATAVQIGDPITQKKLSDAIVKEARDEELYNSITDNGAGGLSCSVAEMARESGGFTVELEKVPLKYPGLQPWEIWISESQERMTLAVPDSNLDEFQELMQRRGVESTVIGRFNDSGRGIVRFNDKEIFNLDMEFLHEGLPRREFVTQDYPYKTQEPVIEVKDQRELFEKMLASHNLCSFEFISTQYDHEVQNNSIIKPLHGPGRVNSASQVIRPVLGSRKGVVISSALYPRLSEVSAYYMAACAMDTAIRNAIAAGGNIDHMALLDNFCWCSSDDPRRLRQLKDAAKACYDYAKIYKTPFISGKDSMFNDFNGYDKDGNPLKISVYPTLLISSLGVIEDIARTTTMDFKKKGDIIYVIGKTYDECAASELYNIHGEIGGKEPRVMVNRKLYHQICQLHDKISACYAPGPGGLLIGLAKMAIAGRLGAELDLDKCIHEEMSPERLFYSESQGRFIVSVPTQKDEEFRESLKGHPIAAIGTVSDRFSIYMGSRHIMEYETAEIEEIYKQRFRGW